jgi:cell division GTPase FtsZ
MPKATDADSALLVVAGDSDRIPRKGVEKARKWLEDETGSLQVRGGDFPLDSERLASLVLLGGVERSPRMQEYMERAKEANKQETRKQDPAEMFHNDELDDLF